MEEIYKLLDKIMRLNHELAGYYIKMAETEILKKPEDKWLQMGAKSRIEQIRKLYIKLADKMQEIGMERTETINENWYSHFSVTTKNPQKIDDDVSVDIREDILDYIEESYTHMYFTSDLEKDIISIYDGKREEMIRESEYETYRNNIACIEDRMGIDASDIKEWGFIKTAQIIEDLADNVAYEKSANAIAKVIRKLDSGEYTFNSDAEKSRIRMGLIYMKYNDMYRDVNQKNNGIVANSIYKSMLEGAEGRKSIHLILGLDKDEFNTIYKSRIYECLDNSKGDVKLEFQQGRDNKTVKKKVGENLVESIKENISKLAEKKDIFKKVEIPNSDGR